jgi:hypothetical protein
MYPNPRFRKILGCRPWRETKFDAKASGLEPRDSMTAQLIENKQEEQIVVQYLGFYPLFFITQGQLSISAYCINHLRIFAIRGWKSLQTFSLLSFSRQIKIIAGGASPPLPPPHAPRVMAGGVLKNRTGKDVKGRWKCQRQRIKLDCEYKFSIKFSQLFLRDVCACTVMCIYTWQYSKM